MTGIAVPSSRRVLPGRHVDVSTVTGRIARRLNPVGFVQTMLIICLILVIWPASFGGRFSLTLVGGNSMEPTYALGDAVVTWREPVEHGDAVLFRIPEGEFGEGNPVIHRVIGGDRGGWVTQGDNISLPDQWRPSNRDVLGVAKFRIPLGGRAVAVVQSWLFLALLAGIAAGLLFWPDPEQQSKLTEPRRGRHRA